jgi:2-dehydro-3-deoxygluconokinase
VERAIEYARDADATLSLDVNLRRRLWSDEAAAPVLRDLARRVDILLGNPDELAVITGQGPGHEPAALVRAALDLGPGIVVAKLGGRGAVASDRDDADTTVAHPGFSLPVVVDPVGAGDAFCAGFIAARLDGSALATALEHGNACGAAAAAALGDQTGLPDRAELAAILRASREDGSPDTIR